MKTDKRKLRCPSRKRVLSSGLRELLCNPRVLKVVIRIANMICHIIDKLTGDNPCSFYVIKGKLQCNMKHFA